MMVSYIIFGGLILSALGIALASDDPASMTSWFWRTVGLIIGLVIIQVIWGRGGQDGENHDETPPWPSPSSDMRPEDQTQWLELIEMHSQPHSVTPDDVHQLLGEPDEVIRSVESIQWRYGTRSLVFGGRPLHLIEMCPGDHITATAELDQATTTLEGVVAAMEVTVSKRGPRTDAILRPEDRSHIASETNQHIEMRTLTTCVCGEPVRTGATYCPRCGKKNRTPPIDRRFGRYMIVLIVLVLLAGAFLLGNRFGGKWTLQPAGDITNWPRLVEMYNRGDPLTPEDVRRLVGEPDQTRRTSESMLWDYDGGRRVLFEGNPFLVTRVLPRD